LHRSRFRAYLAALFAIAIAGCVMPNTAAAASKLAGVQTHLLWSDVDDAEMKRQLDLVKASGAALTRVDVGWASVQQGGPGRLESWYTGRLDALVAAADARGVELLLTFMNTPCWASTAPETLKQNCSGEWWSRGVTAYAPQDPAAYAAALGMLAARYKGKVLAWEIWNEPNHPDFWKAPDQAAAYAALVKAAYPAVKNADPGATVVAGSLSQSDHEFTARLYDLGIKGSFDAFSVHPYSDDISPLDPRSWIDPRYSFVRGVQAVRDVMVRNGDTRPMWLTEAGFSTADIRTADHWRNGVSEETQARFIRDQLDQVARWPFVDATVWFNLKDTSNDKYDLYGNCGLRRWDGSAKPAWAAFQKGLAEVAAFSGQSPDGGTGAGGGQGAPAPSPTVTPTPTAPAPTPPAPTPVPPAPTPVPTPVPPAPTPAPTAPPATGTAPTAPPVTTPAPTPTATPTKPKPKSKRRPVTRTRAKVTARVSRSSKPAKRTTARSKRARR
jgi:hypothetical protein